jgi:hypothetical protein
LLDWRSCRQVLLLRVADDDEIGHLPREWGLLPSIARSEFDGHRLA